MHNPPEYFVVSHNEDAYSDKQGKKIYLGSFEQCQNKIKEISAKFPDYGKKLCIISFNAVK